MSFKIGQKVVCIDDVPKMFPGPSLIKKGKIYTIETIVNNNNGVGVILEEVKSINNKNGSYLASRFRPLKEDKSAIKDLCNDFIEVLEKSDIKVKELI